MNAPRPWLRPDQSEGRANQGRCAHSPVQVSVNFTAPLSRYSLVRQVPTGGGGLLRRGLLRQRGLLRCGLLLNSGLFRRGLLLKGGLLGQSSLLFSL